MNDHDNTYADTMTSLEKRLEHKLDEILRGSNRENLSGPMEDSRQATDGSGNHNHADVQPRSRTF